MQFNHDEDAQVFTTEVDGHIAHIDYHLSGDTAAFLHTIVPDAIGGRGIAGKLTEFALNTAKGKGWKVIPSCSYTAAYVARHPEYNDLLAK
ncbi:acetyltransferase [Pelistega indica]|uniref:Acetyltransferase n=1 Tax=Pelistega indica TaxID=1414851 RepID=V8FUK4_9BURK|nr:MULTISPECIES: GNAT family N-acetyltransferase [Pelistega]ETD67949.1 acetyltransferase [Pelistega indica]